MARRLTLPPVLLVHPRALPASASPSASASASPSASSGKHYKGLVKFDNFEKNGEYVPATATHRAQNAQKPLVPANMNEQNVDGIYAFVGYWLEFQLSADDRRYWAAAEGWICGFLQNYQNLTVAYENNAGWLHGCG